MGHRLDGALARTQRAGQHIQELRSRIDAFTERQGQLITPEGQTYVPGEVPRQAIEQPPIILSILVGETIYNLRAALDYLVYALAAADSGSLQSGTQFLIVNSPKEFKRLAPRYLKGLSQSHIAAIEKLQPYNRCDWTERIREISNPDKHRHLHALASAPFGLTGFWIGSTAPTRENPLGIKVDMEHGRHVQVTFDDGTTVVPTLKILQASVTETLQTFQSEC